MALITKMLDIAVADANAECITKSQLLSIFQEAIDDGDILEKDNEYCVVAHVIPLVGVGILKSSEHTKVFNERMNARLSAIAQKARQNRWWQFWK